METKFAQGQEVFAIEGDSIVNTFTIDSISIEIEIDKEGADTNIRYNCSREVAIGLLSSETTSGSFYEDDNEVFATLDEAKVYIEKIKDAKDVLETAGMSVYY